MGTDLYRNKIRVRVNGILIEDSSLLMIQIHSPVTGQLVWMPPGGGLEFGESLKDCLKREFEEETGICVRVNEFLFLNELIDNSYHAVELFYRVEQTGGIMDLGSDPEHDNQSQLLKDIAWKPLSELNNLLVSPDNLIEELQQIDL